MKWSQGCNETEAWRVRGAEVGRGAGQLDMSLMRASQIDGNNLGSSVNMCVSECVRVCHMLSCCALMLT